MQTAIYVRFFLPVLIFIEDFKTNTRGKLSYRSHKHFKGTENSEFSNYKFSLVGKKTRIHSWKQS